MQASTIRPLELKEKMADGKISYNFVLEYRIPQKVEMEGMWSKETGYSNILEVFILET